MLSVRSRTVRAIAVFAFLLCAFVAEPFSTRYDGYPARQWLAHYSRTRTLPERAVVSHFGAEAIPLLLRQSRPSGLFTFSLAVERRLPNRFFDSIRADDFDRRLACNDWARLLLDLDPAAFTLALTQESDNERAIELTRLFFGDRDLGPTLKRYSAQRTNEMLQARADQLLDIYRGVN